MTASWIVAAMLAGAVVGAGSGGVLVIAAAALGAAIFTLRWPEWSVVGLLAWLPLEIGLSALLSMPSAVALASDLVSAVILISVLVTRLLAEGRGRSERWSGFAIAVIGVFAFAALLSWAVNRSDAVSGLLWTRGFMRYSPIVLFLASYHGRAILKGSILRVAYFVGGVQIVTGLVQLVSGGAVTSRMIPPTTTIGSFSMSRVGVIDLGGRVLIGTVGHYNILGLMSVMLVSVYLGALLERHKVSLHREAWLYSFAGALSVLVVLGESRQSIACLSVVWMYFVLLRTSRADKRAPALVFAVLLAAMLTVLAWDAIGQLQSTRRLAQLNDAAYWQSAIAKNRGYVSTKVLSAAFRVSPLVGIGPGMLTAKASRQSIYLVTTRLGLEPTYSSFVADVGWVNMTVHLGVVGLLVMTAVSAGLLRAAASNELSAQTRLYAIGAFAVLAIGSLASTPIVYKPTGIWLMALMSLVAYEWRKDHALKNTDAQEH